MDLNKKGKILKIKAGYKPNCSSGMWSIYYAIIGFGMSLGTTAASIMTTILLYRRHIKRNLENNNPKLASSEYNESEI